MSDMNEDNGSVPIIAIPSFSHIDTIGWFNEVEQMFRRCRIASQIAKYFVVALHLPPLVAGLVIHLLRDEKPGPQPYDTLKAAIIGTTTGSAHMRLRELLSGMELGNHTPSQLFQQMFRVVKTPRDQDPLLLRVWAQRLPMEISEVVPVAGPNTPIKRLLTMADEIHQWLTITGRKEEGACWRGQIEFSGPGVVENT
ncbi:unnamed protein product [Mesocestoides corti]|uniref:DUF7041 domain-containing protein n=2 Tax=Mesocestoides corti TaxID=53468 RepID=A0A0R3U8R0_MESCO|nr:unnamed protein product [Mesocestoides corti]